MKTQIKLIHQDPQEFFTQLLGKHHGGNVLDVATGPGGFVGILKTCLASFSHITGIDVSPEQLEKATAAFPEESITFERMDAAKMSYPDAAFDLVACAFSLHHLPDVPKALAEMSRVLKPSGYLLVVEMYQDNITETQRTESLVHHWAADIDTALGVSHNHTFTRQGIIDLVQPLTLKNTEIFDLADLGFDPKGEEIVGQVQQTIDRVIEKARSLPDFEEYQKQGEWLRQRLLEIGCHISTRVVIWGQK